jgi:hypothetical protein
MTRSTDLRKRLESTEFPDLGAMMEGYARAAAELAKREFKHKLDFSSDSIEALDEILVMVGESPELDLDFETRLWGSYLGEVLRRRYAGSWEMTQYPGGLVAVPAVAHNRRRRGSERLLHHGHRAVGQAGTGELGCAGMVGLGTQFLRG